MALPGGQGPQSPLKFVVPHAAFADSLGPLDGGDGESWWSGTQMGFVSVPLAGAVAALSLTVATLGGFNHQDELEAKVIGASESQQVIAIADERPPSVFQDDEAILPTAIASTDGGEWIAPTWIVPKAWINDPNWDNDVPVKPAVENDYEWDAQWIQVLPIGIPQWADDSFVPSVIDDEYGYVPYAEPVTIQLVNWPEAGIGDGTPLPPSFTEELEWQVQTPALIAARVPSPAWQTDEMVTAPAPFVLEEDYWYQVRPDPVELVVVEWPPQGASAGGTAPTPISIEEENWSVWTPQLVPANRLYLPDPEQIPAGSLVSQAYGSQSFTALNWRAVSTTKFVSWATPDDLPIPPLPLNIEEENWMVWTPPLVAAQPLFLPDPEQIPAGLIAPPIIEEEDWRVKTPPLVEAKQLYLPDPEQIPAGLVAPPIVEEEDWKVWTPPLVAALPLYLPEPEEVSAGTLIPPIVEIGIPAPIGHPVYIKGQRKKPRIYETANEQLKKILESITIEVVTPGSKSTDAPVLVKAISGKPVRPAPSAEAPAGFMPEAGEPPVPPDLEEEEIIALMAKWLV